MQKKTSFKNGDPAFGVEGTFRIEDLIYVLNEEANHTLILTLADNFGYHVGPLELSQGMFDDAGQFPFYAARMQHKITKEERFADLMGATPETPLNLTISTQFMDHAKLSLADPRIHDQILSAAWQRQDLEYYDRPGDRFDDHILGRMRGFVQNMVAVPIEAWDDFITDAIDYHAQDFIRALALWASRHSDNTPREIKLNRYETETLDPARPFVLKFPYNEFPWHPAP